MTQRDPGTEHRDQERFDSTKYWRRRYRKGGNSGSGSYGRLSVYKAQIVNELVAEKGLNSIIEHGSGDGHQAALFDVDTYTGLDVSPHAIKRCREKFIDRTKWSFHQLSFIRYLSLHDAALSLDVIYHLVEYETFNTYMSRIFATARKYVLIYSTDEELTSKANHVRHRNYSKWISENRPDWMRVRSYTHPYPRREGEDERQTALAYFQLFEFQDTKSCTVMRPEREA